MVSLVGVHTAAKIFDKRYRLDFFDKDKLPLFNQTTLADGWLMRSLKAPLKSSMHVFFHNRQESLTLCLRRNENFQNLLTRVGLSAVDVKKAIRLINAVHLLKQMKAGQVLNVDIAYKDGDVLLKKIHFSPTLEYNVVLQARDDHEFNVQKNMIPLIRQLRIAEGNLSGTFQSVALKDKIPSHVTVQSTSLMVSQGLSGKDGKNNRYQIVYEVFLSPEGKVVKEGQLLYAGYVINNQLHRAYYVKTNNGPAGFYNDQGMAVARTRLQRPLSIPLRITSPFGMRSISTSRGFSRHHPAIDYGAPSGTPVLAASGGRVIKACYNGGYGNYVLISHGSGFQTAYAHLRNFATKVGEYVKAGQKIGEVGSTGHSTGPHLHFEVVINGVKVDPNRGQLLPVNQLDRSSIGQLNTVKKLVSDTLSKNKSQRLEKIQLVSATTSKTKSLTTNTSFG